MKLRIFYALLWQLFMVFHRHGALCDYKEDNWIEPNAWGREVHAPELVLDVLANDSPVCQNCEACNSAPTCSSSSDDAVAFLYYKKFIANIFQRQKLQYDESAELYRRALLFTISSAQLEKLQKLHDPRDLDSVLTEVFAAVRTPSSYDSRFCTANVAGPGIFALIWDILKDLALLLIASEVQFTLLLATALMLGWYFHRKYQTSIILMTVGGAIFFGYFVTYLECNRKLEIENMLETIERYENTAQEQTEPRWYTPIVKLFSSNDPEKAKRYEQINKSSKINLGFCRPDHVFMLYANDLLLKQLEFILEKCTSTLLTLKNSLPWPFNYLAPIMLLFMIAYIIKLTFKYILSPRAWASLWHRPYADAPPPHAQYQLPHSGVAAIHEDRISGDNLKLLLNAIVAPRSSATNVLVSNNSITAAPPPVSGVDEVVEQLEPVPLDLSSNSQPTGTETSSKTNTSPNDSMVNASSYQSKVKAFNNNIEETIREKYDEKTKVSLENLRDDDVTA